MTDKFLESRRPSLFFMNSTNLCSIQSVSGHTVAINTVDCKCMQMSKDIGEEVFYLIGISAVHIVVWVVEFQDQRYKIRRFSHKSKQIDRQFWYSLKWNIADPIKKEAKIKILHSWGVQTLWFFKSGHYWIFFWTFWFMTGSLFNLLSPCLKLQNR